MAKCRSSSFIACCELLYYWLWPIWITQSRNSPVLEVGAVAGYSLYQRTLHMVHNAPWCLYCFFLTVVLNVDTAVPLVRASARHFLYYHSLRLECLFPVRTEDFTLVQFAHQTNQNQEFSKTVWWFNSQYIYKEILTQQLLKSGSWQSVITNTFHLIK
jgi:hypothetical protein